MRLFGFHGIIDGTQYILDITVELFENVRVVRPPEDDSHNSELTITIATNPGLESWTCSTVRSPPPPGPSLDPRPGPES